MSNTQLNWNSSASGVEHFFELRSLRSFLKRADGTTAVEFAIMLALIVSGVMLAAQGLSQATKSSLEEIALVTPAGSQSNASSTAPVELQLVTLEPQPSWLSANQHQIERVVIIVLLIACFCLLRTHRRTLEKKMPEQEAKLPETEQQLQVFLKRQEIYRTLSSNLDSLFNSQMQVQHLMSKQVTTVEPQATASQMKLLMKQRQLRHLLICNKERKLVGIVSDRDLHCDDSKTAWQLMSKDLITVPPESLISTVISLILKEKISSLPIVSDGHIHGVLTTTDLIMAMQCTLKLWHEANSLKADKGNASAELEEQNLEMEHSEPELTAV